MSRPLATESVYRAIAHPVRRAVLDALRDGERSVGDIHQSLARLSRPALSNHMRILRESGLIRQRRRGSNRMYQLDAKPMDELLGWVRTFQPLITARSRAQAAKPPK